MEANLKTGLYFYIAQNTWGLFDRQKIVKTNNDIRGFYSHPGGPCRAVVLFCKQTSRGAFSHSQPGQNDPKEIIDWLTCNDDKNKINIWAQGDQTLHEYTRWIGDERVGLTKNDVEWGFNFTERDFGPVDPVHIDQDLLEDDYLSSNIRAYVVNINGDTTGHDSHEPIEDFFD